MLVKVKWNINSYSFRKYYHMHFHPCQPIFWFVPINRHLLGTFIDKEKYEKLNSSNCYYNKGREKFLPPCISPCSSHFWSLSEVAQFYLTVCDSVDCSLWGFSVYGIVQAKILEWVAIYFSRRSSWPRDQTWVSCFAGRLFTILAIGKHLSKCLDLVFPKYLRIIVQR